MLGASKFANVSPVLANIPFRVTRQNFLVVLYPIGLILFIYSLCSSNHVTFRYNNKLIDYNGFLQRSISANITMNRDKTVKVTLQFT